MTVLVGDQITEYRVKVLRAGLKLGMKRHGRSCYTIIKKEFGFKGSRARVLEQLEGYINDHS